jgi:hypothetical protein
MIGEKHPESPPLRVAEAGLGATGSRPFIVAIRLILLLLASGAMALGWAIAFRDRSPSGTRYVCPMHLEVVAREPGICPICRMALEQRTDSATAADSPGASTNDEVEAVENVRKHNVIDFVRRRSLLPHTRELRGGAWIEDDGSISAVLYRDQVDVIAAGEQGTFSLTRVPSVAVPVRRTSDAPVVWDASTSRIRFRPENAKGKTPSPLHPGDVGWLEVAPLPRDVLAVPASAVLQSPEGPYVLAWTGMGYQFDKRSVEIGETFAKHGFAVVLSGLRANERVVARAAFFLDAERRMAGRMNEGGGAAR